MPDPLDVERIRAYCEKATAAPWEIGHADIPDDWNLGERICAGGKVVAATIEPEYSNDPLAITREQGKAIATFIANARTDLPTAIAEIERLRELLALAYPHVSRNHHETLQMAIRAALHPAENKALRNEQGCK